MRTHVYPDSSSWMIEFRTQDISWRPWDSTATPDRDTALQYLNILREGWEGIREFRLVEIRTSYYEDGEP